MTDRNDTIAGPAEGGPDRGDRREFLRKAGLGGVAAGTLWAAPSILSLDAAYAAGTCGSGTSSFAWSTGGNNTRYNTAGKVGTTTTANIDIRIIATAQNGVFNAGILGHNWMTRAAATSALNCGSAATTDYPMGNEASFYTLQMHNSAPSNNNCGGNGTAGRWAEVEFGFFDAGTTTPHAVRSLGFKLLDVDNASYTDQAEVFVNGSGTRATTGAGGIFTTVTLGGGVTQPTAGTARFVGTGNTAANSAASNVTLGSNNSTDITSVRVRFTDILAGGPTSIQWIGIGDLTFCKV